MSIHIKREEIGELFHKHLGTDLGATDPPYLVNAARDELEIRVAERTEELAKTNYDLLSEISTRKIAEEQKIELLQRVAKTQEDERSRIARDLHDQMGQRLTGFRLKLQSFIGASGEDAKMREQLEWVQKMCEALDADIGFLALELRPPMLDHRIVELAFRLQDTYRIQGRRQKTIFRQVAKC